MPLTRYFDKPGNSKPGEGPKVMAAMKRRYGEKGGERVFYATVNKMRKDSSAQRAAQPKRPPGSALMDARRRRARGRARGRQLSGPPNAFGQRIEGASTSTTRLGY